MSSIQKSRTTNFYIGLSLLLILAGISLVITADYATGPKAKKGDTTSILTEGATYPWGESGPNFVYRKGNNYEFCKLSKCWSFDGEAQKVLKDGNYYNMPNKMYSSSEIVYGVDHQNFSLNSSNNTVYLCSDEFCWYIDEGINNLVETKEFVNTSGESSQPFLNFKPLTI